MPLLAKLAIAWMLGIILCDFQYTAAGLYICGVLCIIFYLKNKILPVVYLLITITGIGRMYYAQTSVSYQPFATPQWYTISDNRTNWQTQNITAFAPDESTTLPR